MNTKANGFLAKSENIKLLLRGFYGFCALLVGIDLSIHRHIVHNWEKLPIFYAVFGFFSCVALVLIAKVLRFILMRKPDYYDA